MKNASDGKERTTVGFAELGFPEVPLVGRYAYTRAHPPLRQHVHRNAFEACILQRGTQTYTIGPLRLDLEAGDMIITKPGEAHGTGTEPENRGCLYWVQFVKPAPGKSFLSFSVHETERLFERLSNFPDRLFHRCDSLIPTFDRILSPPANDGWLLPNAHLRNLLERLVLDLADLTGHTERQRHSGGVQRALVHLEEHCSDHVSVTGLARLAGMSESCFKTRFTRETGMTPMDYWLRRRTERAKILLRDTDRAITSIALDLGFATSQHFATVFKRLTDYTPSAFRNVSRTRSKKPARPATGTGPGFHPVDIRKG